MKTRYQYIHFEQVGNPFATKREKPAYDCLNNRSGDTLGRVLWYAPWRQYVYVPAQQAVYSVGCLADIGDFIRQLAGEPATDCTP